MDQLLEKLFESVPKVRVLRLFVQNPQARFMLSEIAQRTQLGQKVVQRELLKFLKIGLIQKKASAILATGQLVEALRRKLRKRPHYNLNAEFPVLHELQELIVRSSTTSRKKLFGQIKALGKVRLAVISGVFLNSDRSRTDLLIVGDDIPRRRIEKFLAQIESEIGKTLSYTMMETDEFRYRMNMFDRFLRDILEYPHEKIINKLDI